MRNDREEENYVTLVVMLLLLSCANLFRNLGKCRTNM